MQLAVQETTSNIRNNKFYLYEGKLKLIMLLKKYQKVDFIKSIQIFLKTLNYLKDNNPDNKFQKLIYVRKSQIYLNQ